MTPSCEAEKEDQRYFNSPPHKKNHIATTMINTVFFKISTHILTKRMTDGFPTFCILCVISTHILTKRMTVSVQTPSPRILYFNSHPHEEDDDVSRLQPQTKEVISTHILTKRMTNLLNVHFCRNVFQLTSSRRGWPPVPQSRSAGYISTHILTKRMTQLMLIFQLLFTINSTSYRRRLRYRCWFVYFTFFISTHILTKRMTAFRNGNLMESIFQLTSSRRGWQQF